MLALASRALFLYIECCRQYITVASHELWRAETGDQSSGTTRRSLHVVRISRSASSNLERQAPPWEYAQTPSVRVLLSSEKTVLAAELNDVAGLAWHVYQALPFLFV